jgi:hypothetical protein
MKQNVIAGGTLGFLFGFAMGLSSSPIVNTVMGALVGVVAAFLTLKGGFQHSKTADPETETKLMRRLTAFAVCAVLGILGGLILRANNLLSTSPTYQEYRELLSIGFPETEARAIIRSRFEKEPSKVDDRQQRWTALFSGQSADVCRQLDVDRFATAADAIAKYKGSGAPWADFADEVAAKVQGEDNQKQTLKAFHNFVCTLNRKINP